MKKTIVILAANPKDTSRLRLDQEVRDINEGLNRAKKRGKFVLKHIWAARPKDIRRAMLDMKPNIVHFCGHGAGENGIAFEDESGNTKLVNTKALSDFFALFSDTIECVLLNACYSEAQTAAIASHINYVIGMKKGIKDDMAIKFAVAFYDGIVAGKSIKFAFDLACNAINWENTPQSSIPSLNIKQDSNAQKDVNGGLRINKPQQNNDNSLFEILHKIFDSKEAVRQFSDIHFKGTNDHYTPEKGRSVAIQTLINYCERHELLENLIGIIQREYPVEYEKFQKGLYYPNPEPEASLIINKGVVELRLRGDIDLQNPNIDDFLKDLKKSLVNYFGLKLEDVFIMEIRRGSIIVRGLFSKSAIDKLKQTDSEILAKEFGIEAIEILDSILVKTDLQGANLKGTNLSGDDLKSADLRGANIQEANLYRTIFRLADMRRADLRRANLQEADLRGANLSNANLEGADLTGANLEEANLDNTILIGADLRLTKLSREQLENTIYDQKTKMPF
jgi:uncharacterized protein YjbI with pentapeptide repeats